MSTNEPAELRRSCTGQPAGDAMGEVVAGVARVSSHRIAPTGDDFGGWF
ncbi:MAG: hypothetical protein H6656_17745 [Ardenticatenaceae bacterium]|nr:hypothetical protein [Ardenticatenaceae bacterium]